MKIKRYVVNNMPEALSLIKRDLGPEAVIISSRKVRLPGWRGWLAPEQLEVTAALDEKDDSSTQQVLWQEERRKWAQEIAEVKTLLKQVTMAQAPGNEPGELARWRKLLLDLEIKAEIIDQLLQGIADNTGVARDDATMRQQLLDRVAGMFAPGHPAGASARVLTFVGPTGVGKTTTLAKLAAQFSIFNKRKVALVTLDTYRIGAVDQLQTYGEILGVPVEVVMTPKELKEAVHRHREKDAILIDTAGRPSKNRMSIAELRGFLDAIAPMETFLVLSCTTKNRDLMSVVEDFKVLNYNSLIFTKTDETEALGAILNIAHATSMPVAYVTNGQNVPDDIEVVDPQKLAKMILGAVG
ncbi:hypothetical protein SY88_04020 [Clostridiales bacterium PH28_bin88]|nr:hypothetical protein SY88_04020 [Clostridiales bacterium PH28_bin88]